MGDELEGDGMEGTGETAGVTAREISILAPGAPLAGVLSLPAPARAVALFVSPEPEESAGGDEVVARALHAAGIGTLAFDMLTPEERRTDERTGHLRLDTELLAERVCAATDALLRARDTAALPLAYVATGTGVAAALRAATTDRRPCAVVARAGRPDLARDCLARVRAPTILIVGAADVPLLPLNEEAFAALVCEKELAVIPGATHTFPEPGALPTVATLTARWIEQRAIQR